MTRGNSRPRHGELCNQGGGKSEMIQTGKDGKKRKNKRANKRTNEIKNKERTNERTKE